MPVTLYESGAEDEQEQRRQINGIQTGVVLDNCDQAMQGKVRVRIPTLELEVWARLSSPGASAGAGNFHAPRPDSEVLVVFANGNPEDAYLLGGLYNTRDQPPIDQPSELQTRRIIRTGLDEEVGHEINFDDAEQSLRITTSTEQQILLDPDKIEIQTTEGTVKITLDLTQQTLRITALTGIELSADTSIKLKAPSIEIGDQQTTSTTIKGQQVMIN